MTALGEGKELDRSEMAGVIRAMEDILKNPHRDFFSQEYLGTLRARADTLSGLDPLGLSEAEKREREAKAAEMAAEMMEMHEAAINHHIENGFASNSEFFSFSSRFQDESFVATLDAMSDKEKEKLANKMADKYNSLDEKEQDDYRKKHPEALKWVGEHNTVGLMGNNKELDKIKKDVEYLGGDAAVKKVENLQVANTNSDKSIEQAQEAGVSASRVFAASATQRVGAKDVTDTVYKAAQEKGVANYKADVQKEKVAALSTLDNMFAKEDNIAAVVAPLQKAGMQAEVTAPKPVEIANNGKSVEANLGHNIG